MRNLFWFFSLLSHYQLETESSFAWPPFSLLLLTPCNVILVKNNTVDFTAYLLHMIHAIDIQCIRVITYVYHYIQLYIY